MRRGPGEAIGAGVVLAMVLAGCSKDAGTEPPARPESGTIFRFSRFTSAPLVSGGEVTLRSLRGKVVLFDLFGTWCLECRRSAPLLVSLHERYRRKGFEIVGLAYEKTGDSAQGRDAVERFRQEFNIPYPLAIGPDVVWEELREKADVPGVVPMLLVMDRQGVVRDVFEGLPPGHEAILADRVERLLAEPHVPLPGE